MEIEGKIDLHIHTTFSDGMKTPSEIVEMYSAAGYDAISVTDHDGVGGIPEALEAGRKAGLTVIPGIEIGTMAREKHEIHLLGYDFDIRDAFLTSRLSEMREYRERRNRRLLAVFQEKGYPLTYEDLIQRPEQVYVGKPNFALAFEKMGLVKSVQEAFLSEELLACPEARALKKMKVLTEDAIRWVHNAGGIAVAAHPMKIRGLGEKGTTVFFDALDGLIGELKEAGIDGVECAHPSANPEEEEMLENLADKYGLIKTRGSDYHGFE